MSESYVSTVRGSSPEAGEIYDHFLKVRRHSWHLSCWAHRPELLRTMIGHFPRLDGTRTVSAKSLAKLGA